MGNLIGPEADGKTTVNPNSTLNGILTQGEGTVVIGDEAVAEDAPLPEPGGDSQTNVLFGLNGNAIEIKGQAELSNAPNVTIANNLIGLDLDRSSRFPGNAGNGIQIDDAGQVVVQNNSIFANKNGVSAGGRITSLSIDRNLIGGGLENQTQEQQSGNRNSGIALSHTAAPVRITANKIGDNVSGIMLDTTENITILRNLVGSGDERVLPNSVGPAISNSRNITVGNRDLPNSFVASGTDGAIRLTDKSASNPSEDDATSNIALIGNSLGSSLGSTVVFGGEKVSSIRLEENDITLFDGNDSLKTAIEIRGAQDSVIRKNRIRADTGISVAPINSVVAENIRISQNNFLDTGFSGDGRIFLFGGAGNDLRDEDEGNNGLDHLTATATRIKPRGGGRFDFETSDFARSLLIGPASDSDADGLGDGVVRLSGSDTDAPDKGVRVEFSANRRSARVFVTDNSAADHDSAPGSVRDPIAPLLVNALEFTADANGPNNLTLRRSGDILEIVDDTSGNVVASRALDDTAIVIVNGADGVSDELRIDFAFGAAFELRDPIIFDAGAGDDLLTLDTGSLNAVPAQQVVIDGGDGEDVLRLAGQSQSLDLTHGGCCSRCPFLPCLL